MYQSLLVISVKRYCIKRDLDGKSKIKSNTASMMSLGLDIELQC